MTIARRTRWTDPSTSRPAELNFNKKELHQQGVLKCFAIKPDLDATCMELVHFIKANKISNFPSLNYSTIYNQVHRRMGELEALGKLIRSEKRKCTVLGSKCQSWKLGFLKQQECQDLSKALGWLIYD